MIKARELKGAKTRARARARRKSPPLKPTMLPKIRKLQLRQKKQRLEIKEADLKAKDASISQPS